MPAYFLDASALVKAYTHEPGSRWVRQVLGRSATRAFISPLSGAEVLAAIARKERLGELDLATRERVAAAFRKDYRRRFAHTALTASVIEKAMALVLSHPLRGYDAVPQCFPANLSVLEYGLNGAPNTTSPQLFSIGFGLPFVAFARRYLPHRNCSLFLQVLRCFNSLRCR